MLKKYFFVFFMIFFNLTARANSNDYTIYYFMTDYKCSTCNKIEKYTNEALSEIDYKNIDFQIVNINEKENKHFITDFNLYTKSVVLFKNDGTSKNLDKIWNYLNDKIKFKDYLKMEIVNFIK